MKDLRGKVAVVTGGASGIGLALARRLGAEGMKLVLADVEPAALAGAAKTLAQAGVECLAVPTDVSRADAVAALDPILITHRDFVYERHLVLPLDF